jgi:proteasome lid subunit RPN8/RPN11
VTDVPHRRKALPLTQSIHWVPVDTKAPAADAYLVFMHQRALNALYDHLRSSADKGVLGFLLGHLYEDPTSSQRFAVIELVMRLTVAIYGDKTTVVVSRVWDKMQEELTRSGAQLLGWYHSHPPAGIELASGDLETHATYFGEPWQWALVIATGRDGSTAGLYRPNREGADGGAVLPFYELLDPRSVTTEGKKRSSVRWLNYKPHKPPAGVTTGRSGPVPAIPETLSFKPAPAAPPPPPPPPPASKKPAPAPPPPPPPSTKLPPLAPVSQMPRTPTLASESVELGFVDKPPLPPLPPPVASSGKVPVVGPPPAPSPPRKRISGKAPQFVMREPPRPASRIGFILTVVGFFIVTAAAVWYFKFGPGLGPPRRQVEAIEAPPPPADSVPAPSPVPAAPPSAPVATPAPAPAAAPETAPTAILRIDRISDSLATAVQSYQERARLLRDGSGDCTMLARGLVQVETQWAAYNAEKRTLTRQLDDARSQRDLLLFSGVDSVEAHYDRSTCRRP